MRPQPLLTNSWTDAETAGLLRALPPMRRARSASERQPDCQSVLARAVEDEVIPRLLLARRPQKLLRASESVERPGAQQVSELASIVLTEEQGRATAYVEAMCDSGVATESLFLDLLAPAARLLGQMWEDDDCTFSDVTMGLLRLANVMRLLGRAFDGEYDAKRPSPSALLVQMPGERHGFGLAMVVHFFRRAGWNVREAPAATSADIISLVQTGWFGIVGISVACDERLQTLAADIRAIRLHSRNRGLGILVGGPPFVAHPHLAALVGADATAVDGRQAVTEAQSLLSLRAHTP